jgi:hypothetical protein
MTLKCHPAFRQAGTSWLKNAPNISFYNHSNPFGFDLLQHLNRIILLFHSTPLISKKISV